MGKQSIDKDLFAERFSQLLTETEENTYTIADKLSLSPGTISRYQNGLIVPKITTVCALADIFDVNPDWLRGEVSARRDRALSMLPPPDVTKDYVTFPVLGEIAAGYEHLAYESWDGDTVDVPRSYLKGRPQTDYFVLSVCGDSMYPLYMDGDKVMILIQPTLNHSGQIGAVIYDNEKATLKRVEYAQGENWLRLIPINPNYPPKRIENEELEKCRILGIPRLILREVND